MRFDTSRPGWARSLLVCFLSATLATHGLVGCDGSAVETAGGPTKPTIVRATTVVDDLEVEVVLTLDERGTRLTGTRTARSPDGTLQVEDVALDVDADGAALVHGDGTGHVAVPGVDGLTLDVAHAESHPGGATYLLTSSLGHEIVVEVDGDADYVIWAAVGLIASIGGLAILATCGFLVYTAIRTCADQNKCWQYKLTRGFCAGACRNC